VRISIADVLAALKAEGLAPAGIDDSARAALAADTTDEMPWHVRTAIGAGAWLATGFLLGSVLAIAGLDDDVERAIVGVLLMVTAVFVRRGASAEFLRQGAVAACLAGQALFLAGFGESVDSVTGVGLAGVVLSLALIWLMPDSVHRFLSTLIGAGSAVVAAVASELPFAFDLATLALVALAAYVWRVGIRDRDAAFAEMVQPVGYGLVVALFGILLFSTATAVGEGAGSVFVTVNSTRRDFGDPRQALGPICTIGITLAFAALVWKIIDEHGDAHDDRRSVAALAGVLALGAGALSSPGIVAGAAVLVLAFDRRDKVLLGLAVVFLLVFGSAYYYSLNLTLLEKSAVLAGSGLLLLAIRQRIAPGDERKGPA
jgi:hypothetical protein